MLSSLLPSNSTKWEKVVAEANEFSLAYDNAVNAIKLSKMVSPPSSFLPFLVHEYGLGGLKPFVPNLYNLINEGIEWQRLRGTEAALELALGWLGRTAVLEEESVERSFWNLFQLNLDTVVPEKIELERIEGVVDLSRPQRSKFWRGFHGFDVRPMTFGESHWGGAHWGAYSGARLRPDGALWSFGRTYEFALVPSEAELTALGIWIDPGAGGAELSWGDFSWSEANASWVDNGEEVRGRLMASALSDRVTHVALKDAAGDLIGFRRLKFKHFVSPNLNGEYEFAGVKYAHSPDPTRRVLVEAFTDFGDGVGQTATDVALVLDGQLQTGVPIGTAFVAPSEMQNHLTPFADQANQIEFAPTVRERVRFLLTL
jgi:P2-related tail formation protein